MKSTKKRSADRRATSSSGLSFKRETIRNLSEEEARRVVGGARCTSDSCLGRTCPNSVCTITVDTTL
jgi:hypothetical protein